MLSVQSRGTHQPHDSDSIKRNSQLSPISDSDITFDFNVEEDRTDRAVSCGLKSEDSILAINFIRYFVFLENKILHFMQTVSSYFPLENYKKL